MARTPPPTFNQWIKVDFPKIESLMKKRGHPPGTEMAAFLTLRYYAYWAGLGEYWPIERMIAHELGEDDSQARFPFPGPRI